MKILYLDSSYLSFDFPQTTVHDKLDVIDPFKSLNEASKYLDVNLSFDLILYNPYVFINLIDNPDFNLEYFLSNISVKCIPYSNPKDLLPLSRKIENELIALFPPSMNSKILDINHNYENKCVLVTGAGGSIGSELVIQLLQSGVKKCLCLDLSEFSIFNLKQKLNELKYDNFKIIVGDCGDTELLDSIFLAHNVDIIVNASAYKHVSIMQENPYAALNNNVLSFLQLLKTAHKYGVYDIIHVSTDKAADPSNVMGFSKLLCEQILINANSYLGSSFKYSIVRFGNVVGSSGSVVPIFIDNIKNGKKLYITDDQVERYMMQINDAVSLILRAAIKRENQTYILDMGSPYKIKDLAKKMIQNCFFYFDSKLIKFSGLQEGEKVSEILFTANEAAKMKKLDGVFVIKNHDDSLLKKSEMKLLFSGSINFLFKKIKDFK
ncbi:polysaccharide biosynthesis protein [Gammaproteobacteria bacterium]|nr:polysaccharide biosynthesis protein [Gammaproteobacteria bacterium]